LLTKRAGALVVRLVTAHDITLGCRKRLHRLTGECSTLC
jgi:hypothetical protein